MPRNPTERWQLSFLTRHGCYKGHTGMCRGPFLGDEHAVDRTRFTWKNGSRKVCNRGLFPPEALPWIGFYARGVASSGRQAPTSKVPILSYQRLFVQADTATGADGNVPRRFVSSLFRHGGCQVSVRAAGLRSQVPTSEGRARVFPSTRVGGFLAFDGEIKLDAVC